MKPINYYIALALVFISANVFGQIVMPMDDGGGGTAPPTPATPTKSTNTCGDVILTRGTPPLGVAWYWQTTSTGTDNSNSDVTYTVSVGGTRTIYLRAQKPSNGMWSAPAWISVTVNPIPNPPSPPVVTNVCGYSQLTQSGTGSWYWQGTDPNGMSTADASQYYYAYSSGTYYIRARSAAGCWSSSVGVAVTHRPIPADPPNPLSSGNACGLVTLSFGGSPSGNTAWYWQTIPGGESFANGAASTFVVSTSGTYYLRARDIVSACWSNGSGQVTVTVNLIPTPPSAPVVTNVCGYSQLTQSGTGSWYWQGTDPNGMSTADASQYYYAYSSGTYYIRARSAAGCWSSSVGAAVTFRPKPATPPNPASSGNTCGPVTLSYAGSPTGTTQWYWQTSSSGTSTTLGYASSTPVSVSGSYYLRAYDSGGNCWSDASSGPVAVTYNPAIGNPTPSGVTRVEPGVVNLSATIGANGTQVNWYSTASGPTLLTTGLTYLTAVSGTTTFYVSSSNPATGCESSRVAVVATVTPKPIITYTSLYFVMGNSVTLSVGNNTYTTYSWLKNGVAFASTPTVVISNQPGSYTVTVTKTSMTGSGTSDAITLAVANMNAIIVNNVRKIGFTTPATVESLPATDRVKTVQYSGGLGNPIQTILSKGSPLQKDVIMPTQYDVLGRQLKGYLPYVSITNDALYRGLALNNSGYTNSEQYQYYQTGIKIAKDSVPYSITDVEPSPLGRPLASTGVGNNWHIKGKKGTQQYLLNRATDAVRIWTVNATGMPVSSATYTDYQLFVNLGTDENGNRVKVYTDKLGRPILKEVEADATTWMRTYSIYDDLGRLAYTLSPEGTKVGNFTPPQPFLDQWAFQYRYDNLNRLVEYKAPAGGWMYTVYDVLNRPVMTQNADQGSRSEWSFVKYDVNGRAVATGYKVIPSSSRTSVQTSVNGQNSLFEISATDAVGYSLTLTYPSAVEADLLSINYYDNYQFLSYTGWNAEAGLSFAFVAEQGSTAYETGVVGLATGAKLKVLGSSTWLNAVQYYDNFYRPLQIIAENHLGGVDRKTNKYNDLRQLIETRLAHHNQSVIVLQKYNFDHAGRVTKIYHNINSAPTDQLVAQYEYNELGQLVDKKLHNTSGTTFLQSLDYRYNIRGWIASINNSELTVNSANNDEANDYFGMEFVYNRTESGLSNAVRYNGNISAIKWKGLGAVTGAPDQKSYKYTYDKADRLTAASSQMSVSSGVWTKEGNVINEAMTYDHNGNIRTLQRNHRKHQLVGITASYIPETVDNLTYTYSATQGNQLIKVEDAVAVGTGVGDFKNNVNVATEYTYNTDGALNADQNKGISSVTYNVLGKASIINFTDGRKIEYIYGAGGNKLKMKNFQGATLLLTTDYLSGFVYENGVLKFFGSPEGRVVKNGSAFEYQYSIADHQGNTRVVFSANTPTPSSYTANFETSTNPDFPNYPGGGIRSGLELYDHTDFSGSAFTSSNLLNAGNNSQIGVAKSFKVYPGDKVKIEAYAKYFSTTQGPTSNLAGFASALAGAFGLSAASTGEAALAFQGLNSYGTVVAAGGGVGGGTFPKAFVNILLFDKNYKFLNVAYEQIDGGAQVGVSPKAAHDYMSKEYIVKEAGYAFVYISNESPTQVDVYFDDVTMTYTPSNIIQYNEYYPFGLQASTSWTREGSSNNYLYNEGSELNQNSGWYETFFRGYDATLGRFHQVDPLAHSSRSQTPYNFAFNNPVLYSDPNGDYPREVMIDMERTGASGSAVDPFGSEGGLLPGQSGGYSYYHSSHMMGPSSGNHWSNSYRSVAGNFGVMSSSAFQNSYNVNFGTAAGQAFLGNNMGTSFGGGLAGLTAAMNSVNAVSYGAGTFTYNFGGKTYGGTYHTENGVATSTATSEVVQSSSGAWIQVGEMDVHDIDWTSKTTVSGNPEVSMLLAATGGLLNTVEMGYAASLVSNGGNYSKASFSQMKHLIKGTKVLGALGNIVSVGSVAYNVATTGQLKGSDLASLAVTGGTIIIGAALTTAAAPFVVAGGIVVGVGILIYGDELDDLITIDVWNH